MNADDRIGVVQTHNEKGENCGVIIKLSDLDEGIRKRLEENE